MTFKRLACFAFALSTVLALFAYWVNRSQGRWRFEAGMERLVERGEPTSYAEWELPEIERDALAFLASTDELFWEWYEGEETALGEWDADVLRSIGLEPQPSRSDVMHVLQSFCEGEGPEAEDLAGKPAFALDAFVSSLDDLHARILFVQGFTAIDARAALQSRVEEEEDWHLPFKGHGMWYCCQMRAANAAVHGRIDEWLENVKLTLHITHLWEAHPSYRYITKAARFQDILLDRVLTWLPRFETGADLTGLEEALLSIGSDEAVRSVCRSVRLEGLDQYQNEQADDPDYFSGEDPYFSSGREKADFLKILESMESQSLTPYPDRDSEEWQNDWALYSYWNHHDGGENILNWVLNDLTSWAPDNLRAKRQLTIAALRAHRVGPAKGLQAVANVQDFYSCQPILTELDAQGTLTLRSVGGDQKAGTEDDLVWSLRSTD